MESNAEREGRRGRREWTLISQAESSQQRSTLSLSTGLPQFLHWGKKKGILGNNSLENKPYHEHSHDNESGARARPLTCAVVHLSYVFRVRSRWRQWESPHEFLVDPFYIRKRNISQK